MSAELKAEYADKIAADNRKIERERKFVDSIDECEVRVARKVLTDFTRRAKERDEVLVRINRKTSVYVARERCYQDEHGNWHRKDEDARGQHYLSLGEQDDTEFETEPE